MKNIPYCWIMRLVALWILMLSPYLMQAHSGKARFHVIIDTDGAADDLRAISLLLGNREVEILAITTSEGALTAIDAGRKVEALLNHFHHQGIPVAAGRSLKAKEPAWRAHSAKVHWGQEQPAMAHQESAASLLARSIEEEEEPVVLLCLGALTNVADALKDKPALASRVAQLVWYNSSAKPLVGANYEVDKKSAKQVLQSGIKIHVVSGQQENPLKVEEALLDSIQATRSSYALFVAEQHRQAPLAALIQSAHLGMWDDLVPLYLLQPALFDTVAISGTLSSHSLRSPISSQQVYSALASLYRGKPDSESRVFYGFPVAPSLYAADVAPMVQATIDRHGMSEWRAGVLTNELHGHLGIYATIGMKMGIRAREYFNIGVDDIVVTSYAGSNPPISCMNDGLQVSTGGTIGHGLIRVEQGLSVRPEAEFAFKNKVIRLKLKAEYAQQISQDVKKAIEAHGNLTEPYWLEIRMLALKYWLEFDRHQLFELVVVQQED